MVDSLGFGQRVTSEELLSQAVNRAGWMMQPEHFLLLSRLCVRPGMYVTPSTFDAVVHWIEGYHHATGCLHGFREWLVTQGDEGNNFGWAGLVRHHLVLHGVSGDEARSIEQLGQWLHQFHTYMEGLPSSRDAMLRIYLDYQAWLASKPWYGPGLLS